MNACKPENSGVCICVYVCKTNEAIRNFKASMNFDRLKMAALKRKESLIAELLLNEIAVGVFEKGHANN